jgi:hypothetical protein
VVTDSEGKVAAFRKGHAKVGGRKKGTLNKSAEQKLIFGNDFKAAIKELALARLTPLEVMHAIMMIKIAKGDYDGAMEAAEKAAPFCHPKLNAAEVRVQHSLVDRTDDELAASILSLREKFAISKRQPSEGPLIDMTMRAELDIEGGDERGDQMLLNDNDGAMPPLAPE